jgi:hypothetical protein
MESSARAWDWEGFSDSAADLRREDANVACQQSISGPRGSLLADALLDALLDAFADESASF